MYPLVESVRIENGQLHHTGLHNNRINMARKAVFGITEHIDIASIVKLPDNLTDQRYKCRLVFYQEKTEYSISPYSQRLIKTLKVITDDTIDYSFKSENRLQLDAAFAKRENCDDIIIVKNGFITDSWAANIILFDGKKWITPATPLLKGIQRENLLLQQKIEEQIVPIADLLLFKKIKLINAMIDFERAPEIDIQEGVVF